MTLAGGCRRAAQRSRVATRRAWRCASPDPSTDVAELATEWAATDAVVGGDSDARALEAAGVRVHRLDV